MKGRDPVSEISEKALRAVYDGWGYSSVPFDEWLARSPFLMDSLAAFQDALYDELRQKVNHLDPAPGYEVGYSTGYGNALRDVLTLLPPKPEPLCKHCGLMQRRHNPSGKCPVQPQPTSFEPEIAAARGEKP